MKSYKEQAGFYSLPEIAEIRIHSDIDAKVIQSGKLLSRYSKDGFDVSNITKENFRLGILPRLSPYDIDYLSNDLRLVEVPEEVTKRLSNERSYDLSVWNRPSQFIRRLKLSQTNFEAPIPGKSRVMDRLASEGVGVCFENLRVESPVPKNGRQSRSRINDEIDINIMGKGRIPFALGSVPDVGSFLSYTTMAMANGMVFISRDKILSDISEQSQLTRDITSYLKEVSLPESLTPNKTELNEFAEIIGLNLSDVGDEYAIKKYYDILRGSWIANVGAAIEASPNGIKRAESLHEAGCDLFRVYSPEGGTEILDTVKDLRRLFKGERNVKLVAGQIMDSVTAQRAEAAGSDAIFIGVAGGSQCTTSVNADIPVKTPNLLYDLRGRISVPVGIEGGGVGTHIMTAFVLGASFVSKPGEIGVSWEGSGGNFIFEDLSGKYYMPYGGEASISAKWWKDSTDEIGRPKFVEGETGVREITKDQMSQTGNIKKLRDQTSVGLVFQRADSISELHKRSCENIVQVTSEASALSQAYAK